MNILCIITSDSALSNYRARKVFELRKNFDKVIVIAKNGKSGTNLHVTGAYPNPFNILKQFGLSKLKLQLEKLFYFPNAGILFIKRAMKKVTIIIESENRNSRIVILTFTPPHSNALLGYEIKRKYPEIKLLIDWQDLWTYDDYHLNKTAKIYQRNLKKLEHAILNTADLNIVTNEFAAETLADTFKIPSSKIVSIYHPFDRSELRQKVKNSISQKKIKFGFLGHFTKPPKVSGERVLAALEYCRTNEIDLEFNIYGDEQKSTKDIIFKNKFEFVSLHKRVKHVESLNNLLINDFLILSLEDLPNTKIIMHGKLSHYLMLQIPIIAFVPEDSFVAELIRRTGSGYIISNEENAGKVLFDIIRNFDYDEYLKNRNAEEIEKVSWTNISKRWLSIFNL